MATFGTGLKSPYYFYDFLRLTGNPIFPLLSTRLTEGAIYIETSVMCSATPDYFSFVLSKLGQKDPSDQIYTMLGTGFKWDSGDTYGSIDVWKDYNTTGAFGNKIKQVTLGNWYSLTGTFDATNRSISAVFDGSSSSASSYYLNDSDQPWTLFGINGRNVHHGEVGIQEVKIYSADQNTLIADLIPCSRFPEWSVGMYDSVNRVFLPATINGVVQTVEGQYFVLGNL